MNKLKVYIASPYTNGKQSENVRRQLEAMKILMDSGFVPFTPLLSHFAEIYNPRNEDEWLQWDIEWLKFCDILVRILPEKNGIVIPSPGADIEEKIAIDMNKKVILVKDLEELKKWADLYYQ